MSKCWAHSLGDCSDTISKEHIVSKGLLKDKMVIVQGFSWCKNKPCKIGINALSKKCLCRHHNSALSPIDEEGIRCFDDFRQMQKIGHERSVLSAPSKESLYYSVDGKNLERWFLKTTINFTSGGSIPIGSNATTKGIPSKDLVDIAFGHKQFEGRAGLYAVVCHQFTPSNTLGFSPLSWHNKYIAGGLFQFYGHRYAVIFSPEGPPERLTGIRVGNEDWGLCQLNYHHQNIIETWRDGTTSQFHETLW